MLIFEPESVAEVGVFSPERAFRRPLGPEPDLSAYRKALELPSGGTAVHSGNGMLNDVFATVAWAFFDAPTRPVRIGRVALDNEPRHLLLISLWDEGWPELRRGISLADAPQSVRELAGQPFDLQLQSSVRRIPGLEERIVDGILAREPPRWARALASDALQPGGLAEFLSSFGPELPARRDSVAPLVRIWLAWKDSDASQVLGQLKKTFPGPKDGRMTKKALLDPRQLPPGLSTMIPDTAILGALAADASPAAVDLSDLRLHDRTVALVGGAPEEIAAVIDSIPTNESPAGTVILDALCRADVETLARWQQADWKGIGTLLRLRPEFAGRPGVAATLSRDELWSAIRRIRGARQRIDIAAAIVLGGGDLDPGPVAISWKASTPAIVKRLAASGIDGHTLEAWLDAMGPSQREALVQDQDVEPGLALAVLERAGTESVKDWHVSLLDTLLQTDPGPAAAGRIFMAALVNQERAAWARAAVKSFQYSYRHAVSEELGPARQLFTSLRIDDVPDWDIGAKLAKALNRALKSGRWSEQAALECEDRAAFQALLDADDRAGLARRVLTHVIQDHAPAADWQVSALTNATATRADPAWVAKQFASMIKAVSEIFKF